MTLPADMLPYVIVLVTFLAELFLSKVFSPLVMRQFQSYRAAKPGTQQRLHLYPASILVTVVENALSLYILLFRSDVSPHRYEPNSIVRQLGGIWLGRILAELVLSLQQQVFGVDLLIHHLVSLITGSQAVFVGLLPWQMNLGIMMELSNPFQSIRVALLELGQKTSQAYLINGVCFVVVFFLCRIATIPLYWYYTLPMILSGKMFEFDWLSIVTALGTHTVFEIMSIYWFGKMVRSVLKLIHGAKKSHK
ncbi:TLC domain-containing protein 4-B-like [Branchiostoma lanceolatum]|uniref:TLC domain-containing protein 4-B-like n=1 Tax=Branchiostoma lanceolatum TaxID=7740 RepID=UPI003453F864